MSMRGFIARTKANLYFKLPFHNHILNIIKHRRFSGLYIPKTIHIEVTNFCNARCTLCPYLKMTRPKGYMPWHIFEKIVDECTQIEGGGLKIILHKDGEPLMDPLLFKRIEHIKTRLKKSHIHFNSNAMLLNEEKADSILNSRLDSITFSVDGASKEIYENIRQGLKYETVEKNILHFLKRKKEMGKEIHVTLQMVINKDNLHEVDDYKKLWGDKADRIFIKKAHNFLVQKTSFQGGVLGEKQLSRCMQTFYLMLFYWNGDVALCCWDYDNLVGVGNIEKGSLLEIYNNEKLTKVRNAMINKNCKDIAPCNICSQIYGKDGPLWD
ncbi:MAG: radical SAM protein [Nitrospirae bacterium]|nr:radical SAM protein [Nitrospirota bacterium]